MTPSPSDEADAADEVDEADEAPGTAPAAAGLGLLSLGGWLLTTTRPWQKPGSPLTLTLEWTASGTLLLCGLVLLTRCVRRVHGTAEPAQWLAAQKLREVVTADRKAFGPVSAEARRQAEQEW
ncbi:hypothetical protein [Streptomyces sp. AP-93]|uniref:hypothetical protein n=1 Tax=Streptomyces sp. AP-93 TaxID=2929048 RepID=UPI001FAF52AA|nr:hypothetical protein [Streptomyces sp. AP-93]MCJ0874073.1 hypothetical protein [Streptomyces sp. AP-93]